MNPYLTILLDHLLEIVVTILAPVLVTIVIRFLTNKTQVQLDGAKENKLHEVLMHAIGYAEEWARKKLVATGEKPPAAMKLEEALKWAEGEAARRGLDVMAREKLEALILAKLGLTRIPSEVVTPQLQRDDKNVVVSPVVPPVTAEELKEDPAPATESPASVPEEK